MRVELRASQEARGSIEPLKRALAQHGIEAVAGRDGEDEVDMLVVVGESRFFLSTLAELAAPPPVLFVAHKGLGVLAEAQLNDAESLAESLAEERFVTQGVLRMACRVGDREILALNEAALLPALNGTFLGCDVKVDDELLWHDRGDGLIVCTPTGSTAYALSAGGPAILSAADVLTVVPVCSEENHPPIVAPSTSTVQLANPEAASGVELVVDGHARFKVQEGSVEIRGADERLQLVRLSERRHGHLLGRVRLKREMGAELANAPPSARFLYKLLEYEGPLTPSEMVRESGLTGRTVRSSLSVLEELGFVIRRASLRDARTDVYDVAERIGPEL